MKTKSDASSPSRDEYPEIPLPLEDLRVVSALARTAFSSEQNLMAWIRTALSLFTFGFSIAQFFQFLELRQNDAGLATAPRRLGISLICAGIVLLVFATIEHLSRIRELKEKGLPRNAISVIPLSTSAGLLVMGTAAFLALYFNWTL